MSRSDLAVSRWKERLTPITVNGLRTFVLDEGVGDPVVFLHGIPTSSFLWRDVVPVVALERRCIVPDLLGFGLADRPDTADLSPDGQAAFLTGVLDALGAERVALVGHDYGALVACEFLARSPERVSAMVVTNTSVWLDDWKSSSLSPLRMINAPVVGKIATFAARPFMLKQAFRFYVDEVDRLTDEVMAVYWHPFTDGFWNVLRRLNEIDGMTSGEFHRWREALYNFQGPGLVAWGANDPTFPPNRGAEIGKLLHDSRTDIFEHANHFLPVDRPDALGRLIVAFLNGSLLR
ncbi:MAG: alpha/beta fold hydrolase [Thermomicrobiales bacterium]|nr:alpha/beta fold hydrolase [Thermomicrobiales bacterium]